MALYNRLGLGLPKLVPPVAEGRFSLAGVTVVNPKAGRAAAQTISVESGVVRSIEAAEAPDALTRYRNCFALPGLIDMHVHLPPDNALRLTRHAAAMYLAHGVTTVREAGDIDGTAIDAARRMEADGRFPAPRVISSGPFVASGRKTFKNTLLINDPGEAPAIARKVAQTGARFMKLYDGLSRPLIDALVEAAEREGLRLLGHVPSALAYEEAGVPEVQHFFGVPGRTDPARDTLLNRTIDWRGVDAPRLEAIVDATLDQKIGNTPTLAMIDALTMFHDPNSERRRASDRLTPALFTDVLWNPKQGGLNTRLSREQLERDIPLALAKKKELIARLSAAGADLYLGTDVLQPFVLPGLALQQEMAHFVDAGLEPEEVWRLATSAAGDRLGVEGLGRIAVAAPADLLLFDADPTRSLSALGSLRAVMRGGRLFEVSALTDAVQSSLAFYRSPVIRHFAAKAAKKGLRSALGR